MAVCPDGAGGAFVAFDLAGGGDDFRVQRVTASGNIPPGWPPNGLPVVTDPAIQSLSSIAPDGFGGVIVAWFDSRNAGYYDIYAQRILADGSIAPGWQVDGMPVTRAPGQQTFPVVMGDGTGGAFFSWDDETSYDIYLQHLTATGEVAPGWPADGLPVSVLPDLQGAPLLAPDGTGGVLVAWGDFRDGLIAVYAQRVTAAGQTPPGWPQDGVRIVVDRYIRELMSDGAGGAYLSCATLGFGDDDYFLQRFTADGSIAPGWPEGGALVCSAPDDRFGIRMVPDGAGGVLLTWYDYRDYPDEIYLLRMQGDGSLFPGWPLNGLRLTNNLVFDSIPQLAEDGLGGGYLSWVRFADSRPVFHRVEGTGAVAPGWPAGGREIPGDTYAGTRIIADGQGGAILVWSRSDGCSPTTCLYTILALKLAPDGPVPVLVSLVSAEAEHDRVRLIWFAADGVNLVATVQRRTETSEWEPLGAITPDGSGQLAYEDRDVAPGTRYAYRLAYAESGVEQYTSEAWVTVPAPRFALRGLTPNPSLGDPVVAFSLPGPEPATLELFDLSGRLVLSREVGALGAGTQSVRLEGRGRLRAGVYTVRLRQGPRIATARAVIIN